MFYTITDAVGYGIRHNLDWPGRSGILLGGVIGFQASIMTRSVWAMLLLALIALAIDFLAGVIFAVRRRDFSVEALYEGAWGKIGRGLLIPIGLLWDAMIFFGAGFFPSAESFAGAVGEIMPWTMLACAWLIIGESGSTVSLIAENGGKNAVPKRFRDFIERITKWLGGEGKGPPPPGA